MYMDIKVPDFDFVEPENNINSEQLKCINYSSSEDVFLISENGDKYLDLTSNNDKNPLGYTNITQNHMQHISLNSHSQVNIHHISQLKKELIELFNVEDALFNHSINDSKLTSLKLADSWIKQYHNVNEYEILDLANWFSTGRVNLLTKQIDNFNSFVPTNMKLEKSYDFNPTLIKTFFTKKTKLIILNPYLIADDEFVIKTDIIKCVEKFFEKYEFCLLCDLSKLSLGRDTNNAILNLPKANLTVLPQSIGITSPLSTILVDSKINQMLLKKNLSISEYSIAAVDNALYYLSVLKDESLLNKIRENTDYFLNGLKNLEEKHISIIDVNNYGFYFVVRTDISTTALKNFFLDHHILIDCLDEKYLLIRPQLCINKSHLDLFLNIFDQSLTSLGNFDHLK